MKNYLKLSLLGGVFCSILQAHAASNPSGICLSDVDGTLTQNSSDDNEAIFQECKKRNFVFAIATANNKRNVSNFCNGNIPIDDKYASGGAHTKWASPSICKAMQANNNIMYNSGRITAGVYDSSLNKYDNGREGYRKAIQADHARNIIFNGNMPHHCVILFDDQQNFIDEYKSFGHNYSAEHIDNGRFNAGYVGNLLANKYADCSGTPSTKFPSPSIIQ